jgi:hypothetical protein
LSSSASVAVEEATQRAGGGLAVLGPRSLEERGLTVRNRTLIGDEHFDDDEYPLQTAVDHDRMIEMQQMSCALAKGVLDNSSLKPTWSWNATQESSMHQRADFIAGASNSSTFANELYAETLSKQQDEKFAHHDSLQEHLNATEESPAHRSARDATAKQGRYTTANIGLYQHNLSIGIGEENMHHHGSQQGSHATEELDARGASGQSFVATEGSSSSDDTRTYPHVSPEDQGERLLQDEQPQGDISHGSNYTVDNSEATHDDRFEAAPSIHGVTREASTSALSGPKPDQASDAEHTAPQEDRSLPLEDATPTPWWSNVPLSQNVLPPPRSISRGSDTVLVHQEQPPREERMLSHETAKRETHENDRLDRIERFLANQALAEEKRLLAKRLKAEAAAIAKREEEEAVAEMKKRGDEDKLAKLEMLILAQKDEQIKREIAAEAAREADKAAADAEAEKISRERKAADERERALLDAAARAREEAEAKAAIELAQKLRAPITFHDPIGRKFSCPWHECSTREVSSNS